MKTNRRKPESVFYLFLPRAKHFSLIFILLLFSFALPPSWITYYRKQRIRQNKSEIIVAEGRSCGVRAGLRTGSGVNLTAVLVLGTFFRKKQGGCDLVPSSCSRAFEAHFSLPPCRCWASTLPSGVGAGVSCRPASLHQRQGFLGWQADKAPPGPGNPLPFQ